MYWRKGNWKQKINISSEKWDHETHKKGVWILYHRHQIAGIVVYWAMVILKVRLMTGLQPIKDKE